MVRTTLQKPTEDVLRDIAQRLVQEFSPRRLYLFGSHAYGTPHPDSDVDLFLVVAEEPAPMEDYHARGYRRLRGLFVPVELHFRGEQEFLERAENPGSFEHDVLTKGRLLYAA